MVKNLPTVERSTKIRFGKNCTDDQAENTIVFNASDTQIDIPFSDSVYMTPLRIRTDLSDRNITVLAYNQITKEVMDSGAIAEDILNFTLEAAVINGNVTANTVSFNNAITSVTTLSNVGVANGSPIHTLDVGSTFNIDIEGSNLLTVLGNTYIQDNLVVDGNMTVNGALTTVNTVNTVVKDPIIELGKYNVSSDLGIIMYRPLSNVAMGFREGSDELVLAYTDSSSYGSVIVPNTNETLDVRVYGRVLTESNVGILNATPTHTLDVGSNLFVDEFGSNILYVTGNTHTTDILSVGNKIGIKVIDPHAELHVGGNVYVSSNLTVDEDTLHVDATAHSVGIETKNPDANLHVVGNVYVSSNLTVDEDTLHVDATAHSVGIETKDPDANLHVVGNVYVSSNLTVDDDTFHVDALTHSVGIETKDPDANLHVVGNVYVSSNLTVDEDTLHVDALTHSVGIETKDPDANLHIVGNVYVSSNLTVDEDTLHVDATAHSVGIETKDPDANLHVVGNVYVSDDLTVAINTLHVDAEYKSIGLGTVNPDANLHVVGNVYVSDDLTVATNTLHVEAGTERVGIKTKNPDAELHVVGNVYMSDDLTVATDALHVEASTQSVGLGTKVPDAKLHVVGNVYVSSNLTVDDNTLHVDATTHSVGIETKSPDANLHVVGNVYVSSNLTVDDNTLHVDATTHSVGVETKTPDANLHVVGNVYVSSNLTVDDDTFHVDALTHSVGIETKNPDANLHVVGNVYVSSNLTVDTDTLHVDTETSRVGLGTKAPAYLLDVHGTSNVGALTAVSGSVANDFTVDTNTLYVDSTENRVGIKTLTPSTELHVEGNVYVSSNIQALTYFGDGGLLSNVTLQVVSDHGNTTSNTIQFTNPTTALTTDLTSNVEVKLNQLANVSITSILPDHTLVYDGSDWINEYPLHTYIKIRNDLNGVNIEAGDTVYVKGTHNSNILNVGLAKSDDPSTMPCIGLSNQLLTPGQEGTAVAYGKALSVVTDTFLTGETVYVSNTVPGGLSNVKPYNNDLIQNVGVVTKVHASNGGVFVTGIGRANDVPNAQVVLDESEINWVYVNTVNNDFKKIEPSNLLTQLQTFEQVSAAGNVVSNVIEFKNVTTGLVTTSNLQVGSNISVTGLIDPINKYLPMVGTDGFFEKSPVYVTDTGKYVISAAEAEFLGNITLSGNNTIISSTSVTIEDRIFGIAANNSATSLDSGFMIEHKDGGTYANVAVIYHADEHRFSVGYTQNTFTDDHILHYEDEDHRMLIDLIGNVEVQHNLVVNETLDVTGAATFANDLTVGAVSNLFVDVSTSRVGINEATPGASLDVGGDVNIQSVTDATSKTSGALVVAGGVGIGGDVYATNTVLSGNLTVDTDTLIVNSTTHLVGINKAVPTVALDVVGDVVITDDFTVDTNTLRVDSVTDRVGINVLAPDASLHVVGNVHVQNTTEAFSTVTGAMTITGGLGVTANVHATQFHGDGSKLTGLVTTLEDVANNGNTMSNTIIFENETTSLVTEGSVGIANTAPIHDLDVGSNLYVDDAGSNVLYVTGNVYATRFIGDGAFLENIASNLHEITNNGNVTTNTVHFEGATSIVTTGKIGIANAAPDHELSVTGNVYVSSEVRVAGGLITNLGGLTKKTYGYSSGTITASTTPEINVVFDSELFSAKITAHLVEPTSNISVLNLDVTGGTGRNIGKGMLSIVGDQNSKHWDTVIATTDTTVTLTPSVGLLSDGTYGIFVEYTSPLGGGGVTSIDKDNTNEITFDY